MTGLVRLTARYLQYHRGKSLLLVLGLALVLLLPMGLQGLLRHYERGLMSRAESTPLVAGARGDRYDLVVNGLYFATDAPGELPFGEMAAIRETGRAAVLPVHARHTAGDAPVVGTDLEYFERRDLAVSAGTLPLRLGDCVLGATAARRLRLEPGDGLRTDQLSLFDLTQYTVELRVVGVLQPVGGPDDSAVFTGLRTAWVLDGHGHGHGDVVAAEPGAVLARETNRVVASEQLLRFREFTTDNLATFHLHGDPDDLPLTAVLVFPHSRKDSDILSAEYNRSEAHQMLDSRQVMGELMALVLRVKRWFNAMFSLFVGAMALFVLLVVLLSLKLRRREMETMFKLGCARGTMVRLQCIEWAFLLASALVLAGVLAGLILVFAPDLRSLL